MGKQVTLTELKNVNLKFVPNYERMNENNQQECCPFMIQLSAFAKGNGATEPITVTDYLGQWRETPYTPKELYQLVNSTNNLHAILANKLKDLYMEINEDISQ